MANNAGQLTSAAWACGAVCARGVGFLAPTNNASLFAVEKCRLHVPLTAGIFRGITMSNAGAAVVIVAKT